MPCRLEIHVIFARKLVTRRENAGSSMNGKRKTLIRNPGETRETLVVPIPAPPFHVIIVGRRGIFCGNAEENGGTREGEEMAGMEADRWRKWLNLWRLYKKS